MYIKVLITTLAIALSPIGVIAKNVSPHMQLKINGGRFIENVGQVKDQNGHTRNDIQFVLHSGGVNIFIGNGALHYQFLKSNDEDRSNKAYRLDVNMINANTNALVSKEDELPGRYIYRLPGLDGITAKTYNKITYHNIYRGIDWVLYLRDGVLEYEFRVHDGADPSMIQMEYTGANSIRRTTGGGVTISTPMGDVKEHAPYTYTADGEEIKSSFAVQGTRLSFKLAAHAGPFTIDPTLTWGTYYGGSNEDHSQGVTTDPSGNIFMCGYTASANNIATATVQQATIGGGTDGFIAKFNSAGVLQWCTYYGGSSDDYLYSVSCDQLGNVYASGRTLSSSGIATAVAHQTTMYGLSDAFLVKLDNTGLLRWCTYYGGFSNEYGYSVACDGAYNVYLCGSTNSGNNIATNGTHQAFQFGGYQAFLVKFDSSGTRQWGSYFGGTNDDYGYAVCTDVANYVYICGRATSTDYIASANAYQQSHAGGGNDGFLAKFNPIDGTTSWSTYYGDAGDDQLLGVACDGGDMLYVCGRTDGTSTIATNLANQSSYGGGNSDGFLVQFDSTGARQWATYYGGSGDDSATGVECDASGNAYITGVTNSSNNIASANTYQNTIGGGRDAFLAKFTYSGSMDWGTYYGGSGDDQGNGVSANLDDIYICGSTGSSSAIATNNAHQAALSSDPDGFLAKMGDCATPPVQPGTITGNNTVCEGTSQNYFISPVVGATTYTWALPNGWTGSSTSTSILATAGSTSGNITVTANNGCGSSTAQSFSVTVNTVPQAVITPGGPTTFCQGDSVTLNANTGNGISYKWRRNATIIPAATSPSYTATLAGSYTVVENNNCGGDTSAATTVTINALPTAVITQNGDQLSTGSFTTYQWYYNGQPINGANNQNYMATQNGDYYVYVTDGNGCGANSDTVTVSNLFINNIQNNASRFTIVPDPNNGTFMLYGNTTDTILHISIRDLTGREIFTGKLVTGSRCTGMIQLSDELPNGLYFISIMGKTSRAALKFMKE